MLNDTLMAKNTKIMDTQVTQFCHSAIIKPTFYEYKDILSLHHVFNCTNHTNYVTLTDCGRILACGSNAFGQLGIGQRVTHSADLLVVEVRNATRQV